MKMISTIRLFKGVLIAHKKKKTYKSLLEKTLKKGFVFSPEVMANYSEEQLIKLISTIEQEFGITSEQINSSFHKSWNKVKTASIEQLVMEQIIHYITTYGFKQLGIDNKESIYIPNEKLEIPELKENFNIIVIKGYTKEELKNKLLKMLQSGVALAEETIKDVVEIATDVGIKGKDIDTIKNKEVKIALYDELEFIPKNPSEFLRYVVYKATGKTLLIKDKATIAMIKEAKNIYVVVLFHKYRKEYGFKVLAQVFYRYKPLFLAFKYSELLNNYVNKIRKLAIKYHKPMPEDYLNTITAKIKKGEKIVLKELKNELNKVNTFRKVRLAYALKYRTKDVNSILYRIRNGKGFAKEFTSNKTVESKMVLDIVLDAIANDISKNVKGKKIFISENVHYTLPATEKQFSGGLPAGSYVTVDKDIVFGIHWDNVKNRQTDLDLSLLSPTTGKIGWDSDYRNEERSILFSGDITDAPNGASELFYVRKQKQDAYIMFVNYYNYSKENPVPFKIIVAKEQVSNLKKNYMVNPNNIVVVAKTKIDKNQKVLGIIVTTTKECRFYFTETYIGNSITSSGKQYAEHTRKFLFDYYTNTISLNKVLEKAGAVLTEDIKDCDIDLSLGTLERDTILNLLF